VEPYYGDQKTRAELRYSLENRKDEFHVIVTTYKLATGAKEDRIFLKKAFNFDVPFQTHRTTLTIGLYFRRRPHAQEQHE
jgi:hypothetical protein